MKSLYDILEVTPKATISEIRNSYLKLAREYHPDRVPEYLTKLRADAEEKVKEINEAWAVLGNPVARRMYDLKLQARPAAPGYSHSAARTPTYSSGRSTGAILDWLRTRREFVRWVLIVALSALVLVVIGELVALPGSRPEPQDKSVEQQIAQHDTAPQRILHYDGKQVRLPTAQYGDRGTLSIQLLSVGLGENKTVVTFRVLGGDRSGALLYEPPGGSTRTRSVMGKKVIVDRGLEEPYLVDSKGRKYYSTSGLLGGNQADFDVYNFTRKINFKPREDVTLWAEFPPLQDGTSSVTFVLPGLAKWQPEWRWPAIDLR